MVEQAIILADGFSAGDGGGPGDPHKFLLGLTRLERAALTLSHGGIQRILVLGQRPGPSGQVRLEVSQRLKKSGAILLWAAWGEPGAELPLPRAPYLLLEAAVVFTAALAQWLHQLEVEGDRLLVPGNSDNPDAARFSGLALCRAASFPFLLAAGGRGGMSPADLLASAPPMPVAGHGWIRAGSRGGEGRARRLLRQSLGKPSDGFFSRHLNRHISWPISQLLIQLHVGPNLVTGVNLALGLFSGWLIGRGGFGSTLAAGLLFQFVSILDGCDGEIARLTFRFSDLGARLDNLCDFVTLAVFFVNLPIGLYAATADISYLALGGLAALLVAVFYLALLVWIKMAGHRGNTAELVRHVQDKGKSGKTLTWMDLLGVRLGFIYRKEFFSLYAMAWCLVDRADIFLWNVVGLAPLGIVFQVYTMFRSERRA